MAELVFEVIQEADGGYCAECLTENIVTQGDTWEDLRGNVVEAVTAYYFDQTRPERIRLIWFAMRCCPWYEDSAQRFWRSFRGCLVQALGVCEGESSGRHVILETKRPGHQRIAIP